MKKLYVFAVMALCASAGYTQEKSMRVQKTDGTFTITRVNEISKIHFLSIADPGKAMVVTTTDSNQATMLFKDQPYITMSEGKLSVSSASSDTPVEIEIDNILEIKFRDATSISTPTEDSGIVCVLQPGAALFRGLPQGMRVTVCTTDGRSIPVQPSTDGELQLSRSKFGKGIYVVHIGTFSTKITL